MPSSFANPVCGYANSFFNVFWSEADQRRRRNLVEESTDLARSCEAFVNDHVSDAHRQVTFIARQHRQPQIGIRRGHGHAWFGVYEIAAFTLGSEIAVTYRISNG